MTPTHLITNAAPALANHLWQSTAFAAAIWLLTLLLRNNHARIRYTLWLAASIKFLLPFSLLITLGTLLPRPQQIAPPSTIYSAIDTASQPFTQPDTITPVTPTPTPTIQARLTAQLPAAIATLWLCGALTVLFIWITRWRQVHATLKKSTPITAGREHEILHRLQTQSSKQITLVRSPELMEPGIFGILRPTLLWPHRLSDHLEDHHIEAILAHETIHVRRRDNLTAALHMLVEAIFWFHPIVWWMERHMIEERERACDEAVVQQGGNPETYAESLLKACRFCLESPLPCIAGITGADLTRRVRSIMTLQLEKLGTVKKLSLVTLGIAALAGPVAFGVVRLHTDRAQILQSTGPLPRFDVAVVRPSDPNNHGGSMDSLPGNFVIENQPLYGIMQYAYNVSADDQIEGQDWERMKNEHYDIHAKASEAEVAALQKLPLEQQYTQVRLMLQALLAERFKMKMSIQNRQLPVYALVVAKGGPKLTQTNCPPGSQTHYSRSLLSCGGVSLEDQGGLNGRAATIHYMIAMIAHIPEMGGRTILDETGLTGIYDWTMHWTPATVATADDSGPSVFTALQEQLGLKLVSTKGPVQVLVIDHIDQPSEEAGGEAPPTPAQPVTPTPKPTPQAAAKPASPSPVVKTPEFDVVSIKPIEPGGRMTTDYFGVVMDSPDSVNAGFVSLVDLIRWAYGYSTYYIQSQVNGIPDWAKNQRYNIEAKLSEAQIAEFAKMTKQDRQRQKELMLQAMLADRFHLKLHHATSQIPVYELVPAKNSNLKPAGENDPAVIKTRSGKPIEGSRIWETQGDRDTIVQQMSMKQISSFLTSQARELDRPVMDKTGLTGNYTFTLNNWSPMISMMIQHGQQTEDMSNIFTALQQQGLKLQPSTGTIEVLAIDHAEKPSPN